MKSVAGGYDCDIIIGQKKNSFDITTLELEKLLEKENIKKNAARGVRMVSLNSIYLNLIE